jgi:2-hydroxy-3-keto-5-methylthiopentenyl-1-phosphate phosphatase
VIKKFISDFDGTMTQYDFYDLACKEFPEILKPGYWQQYEEGKITHFEALKRIFGDIRADESELLEIIAKMGIEPRLAEKIAMLRSNGWDIEVTSAGCAWYINRLLAQQNVTLTVHANKGEFSREHGLVMSMPDDARFVSQELGVNKVAVVREALKETDIVAFAGDGRPDLVSALMVNPKRRFARSWLAKRLREIGEEYVPFETWADIADALVKEEAWHA